MSLNLPRPNFKKFFTTWILLTLVISLPVTLYVTLSGQFDIRKKAEQPEIVYYLFPSAGEYSVGETITTNIKLNAPEGETVPIAEAVLNFDPQVLKVTNISVGADFESAVQTEHDNSSGTINIELLVTDQDVAAGEGIDFAVIEFEALSVSESTQVTQVTFDTDKSEAVSGEGTYFSVTAEDAAYTISDSDGDSDDSGSDDDTDDSGNGSDRTGSEDEPEISSFAPACGPDGIAVSIIGSGFGTTEGTASFGGTNCPILSWRDTRINVEVPSLELDSRETLEITTAEGQTAEAPYSFLAAENPPANKADMNCDGVVNSFDLGILAHFWNSD